MHEGERERTPGEGTGSSFVAPRMIAGTRGNDVKSSDCRSRLGLDARGLEARRLRPASENAVSAGAHQRSYDEQNDPEDQLALQELDDADDCDDYGKNPQYGRIHGRASFA